MKLGRIGNAWQIGRRWTSPYPHRRLSCEEEEEEEEEGCSRYVMCAELCDLPLLLFITPQRLPISESSFSSLCFSLAPAVSRAFPFPSLFSFFFSTCRNENHIRSLALPAFLLVFLSMCRFSACRAYLSGRVKTQSAREGGRICAVW